MFGVGLKEEVHGMQVETLSPLKRLCFARLKRCRLQTKQDFKFLYVELRALKYVVSYLHFNESHQFFIF